jgi:hypothetical protein
MCRNRKARSAHIQNGNTYRHKNDGSKRRPDHGPDFSLTLTHSGEEIKHSDGSWKRSHFVDGFDGRMTIDYNSLVHDCKWQAKQ